MKNKIPGLLPIAVLLLTGCSHDPSGELPSTPETVSLLLSGTQSALETRTSLPELPQGSTTGIYVPEKEKDISTAYFNNACYTAGESGILQASSSTVIDLTVGMSYDIYAYGPFRTIVTDPAAIAFTHGNDVIYAPKSTVTGVTADNRTAILNFEHRAAQIDFSVIFADDYNLTDKQITSASTIEVAGFYPVATLDLITGNLTPTGAATASLSSSGIGAPGAMELAIPPTCFIPGTDQMSLVVKVTHQGKEFNGTITETFVAGMSYRYTVTVNGTVAPLAITGTLRDWTTVSETIPIQ